MIGITIDSAGNVTFAIWLVCIFILVVLADVILRAIGLWKSARKNQVAWFVCLLIFNTITILPIIYLIISRDKRENEH